MGSVNFGQLKIAYLLFDCVLSLILYISISYKEKKKCLPKYHYLSFDFKTVLICQNIVK